MTNRASETMKVHCEYKGREAQWVEHKREKIKAGERDVSPFARRKPVGESQGRKRGNTFRLHPSAERVQTLRSRLGQDILKFQDERYLRSIIKAWLYL